MVSIQRVVARLWWNPTAKSRDKIPMRLRRHWEKKGYSPPVFRYLDLLRFPEAAFVHRDSSED